MSNSLLPPDLMRRELGRLRLNDSLSIFPFKLPVPENHIVLVLPLLRLFFLGSLYIHNLMVRNSWRATVHARPSITQGTHSQIPEWECTCDDLLNEAIQCPMPARMQIVDITGDLDPRIQRKLHLAREPLEPAAISIGRPRVPPIDKRSSTRGTGPSGKF